MAQLLTLGKAAIELRCAEHHLRKLCDLDRIPFVRAGRYRVFDVNDLPRIREALVAAGYLAPSTTEVSAGACHSSFTVRAEHTRTRASLSRFRGPGAQLDQVRSIARD